MSRGWVVLAVAAIIVLLTATWLGCALLGTRAFVWSGDTSGLALCLVLMLMTLAGAGMVAQLLLLSRSMERTA